MNRLSDYDDQIIRATPYETLSDYRSTVSSSAHLLHLRDFPNSLTIQVFPECLRTGPEPALSMEHPEVWVTIRSLKLFLRYYENPAKRVWLKRPLGYIEEAEVRAYRAFVSPRRPLPSMTYRNIHPPLGPPSTTPTSPVLLHKQSQHMGQYGPLLRLPLGPSTSGDSTWKASQLHRATSLANFSNFSNFSNFPNLYNFPNLSDLSNFASFRQDPHRSLTLIARSIAVQGKNRTHGRRPHSPE